MPPNAATRAVNGDKPAGTVNKPTGDNARKGAAGAPEAKPQRKPKA